MSTRSHKLVDDHQSLSKNSGNMNAHRPSLASSGRNRNSNTSHGNNNNNSSGRDRESSFCDQTLDNLTVQRHLTHEDEPLPEDRNNSEVLEQEQPPFEHIVQNKIFRQKTQSKQSMNSRSSASGIGPYKVIKHNFNGGQRRGRHSRQSRGSSLSSQGVAGVGLSARSRTGMNMLHGINGS